MIVDTESSSVLVSSRILSVNCGVVFSTLLDLMLCTRILSNIIDGPIFVLAFIRLHSISLLDFAFLCIARMIVCISFRQVLEPGCSLLLLFLMIV